MNRIVTIPATPCPRCGTIKGEIWVYDGHPDPTVGDVIACVFCKLALMIVADGLRPATADEVAAALKKAGV